MFSYFSSSHPSSTKLRFVIATLSLSLGVSLAHAAASNAPIISNADLTQAGLLRMQIQRTGKLNLQVRLSVLPRQSALLLTQNIEQIENTFQHLAQLPHIENDPILLRTLNRANKSWSSYKEALKQPTLPAANLYAQSESLDQILSQLNARLENIAPNPQPYLIILAQRQTMMSQRMAKLYLLTQMGFTHAGMGVDLAQTRNEFMSGMRILKNLQIANPQASDQLSLANSQWVFYDNALKNLHRQDTNYRQDIATTSERITELMNAMVSETGQKLASN